MELVTERDSAGISIVENSSGQLLAASSWALSPDPILELGGSSESDHEFFRVTGILPLPDGVFAVLNAGTAEVFVIDLSGRMTARFGGRGDGPGEFMRPGSLIRIPPDSIAVFDGSQQRLSVFDAHGRLGRELTLELEGDQSGGARLLSFDTGDLLVARRGGFGEGSRDGVYRTEAEWFTVGQDGIRKSTFGMFPGNEVFAIPGQMGSPLFGARTHAGTMGGDLVVGTAETTEVRVFAPTGTLRTIVRWPDRDRTIPEERVDSFIESAVATVPEVDRARTRQSLLDIPRKDEEAPYEDILTSDQGLFWVGNPEGPEADFLGMPPPPRRWLIFDSTGILTATLETPAGFRPMAIQSDRVFGLAIDELGVESVTVYEIARQ
jgi:hypothetical protein